ncbi:Asp-tRNAAsn/Glu-tRNAGln amidotransferase A subunit and related amidases [Sphingobium indicum BiD32]|uniref:Asp-tRNAAsn/Glu-tRNAGln amidotransferase A subunit and related amidases n=1 Tax=Sphingobium indicum BiD32 TaxID=1301087 RepID=N1MI41_9SPHN|nr:AtzE family amidohydrolase [Sphingobium indicum]CCW16454.1 Asp-tRNAAsn/Glu-tRNAGln amidotransferase A subunit and related amidases [Sphingobium indicum BiD32]
MKQAVDIAAAVRSGHTSAMAVLEDCLARLTTQAGPLVAITRILADRARTEAAAVDAAIAAGKDPGPLAGVPYGVKDLFDICGLPTTAGSSLYADAPPAQADADAISRLHAAGAVLVATLNMDEFAYGFATINARHGTTRNPHDPDRLAGGSSGGSAAAVAAGLLPFSLGSDTNGSIRVPASLTGIYGLKPTHGALPMGGVFPFADSFDDIGPFTLSVADMQCLWQILGGADAAASDPIRVARLGGRFRDNVDPDQIAAMDAIAPDAPLIELPDIARARSAAFLITAAEGGSLHREALGRDAMTFDPATRDRLIAGALLPDALYEAAQTFRAEYRQRILAIIETQDVLLAPATPCVAPLIADPRILIDGALSPARADLGIHSQPISFTGLPSLSVPLHRPGRLPLGLQLIGRPGGEATLFRFAAKLEKTGMTGVTLPHADYRGDA